MFIVKPIGAAGVKGGGGVELKYDCSARLRDI